MFNFSKKTKKEPENLKDVLKYLREMEENYANVSRELKEFKEGSKTKNSVKG